MHNGQEQKIPATFKGETVSYFRSARAEGMDTNPSVVVKRIVENGKETDRRGLFAKDKLLKGDTLGIPVMLVVEGRYLCLLTKYEHDHLREATGSFHDLLVDALRVADEQGLSPITPGLIAQLKAKKRKLYVTGVLSPRLGDRSAYSYSDMDGMATSYVEEPSDNKPNAVFSSELAQLVVLEDVEQGAPVYMSYGSGYIRHWSSDPDACKEYEEEKGSRALLSACSLMAKKTDSVRAGVVECLVAAVARTWKYLRTGMALLDTSYQDGKGVGAARDLFDEVGNHLKSSSNVMERRLGGPTYLAAVEDKDGPNSFVFPLNVYVTDGTNHSAVEEHILRALPDGSTSTVFNVLPVMRYALAKDLMQCKEKSQVDEASRVHAVRAVMVREVMPPAFTSWEAASLVGAVEVWLATHVPPYMRTDAQTKKSVSVMKHALLYIGKTLGSDASVVRLHVSLQVALLAGLTVDTALASKCFMNGQSEFEDYVYDEYAEYADQFLKHETNDGLLAACQLKWEEVHQNQGGNLSGRNRAVPPPTMMGLNSCNSLLVNGYRSMLYLTGTLGSQGCIINLLVQLWMRPEGGGGELCKSRTKYRDWLFYKLQTVAANIDADCSVFAWQTRVLCANTTALTDAHFYLGRGPLRNRDVKVLNARLVIRFWDAVRRGQADGNYVVKDMCQHYKFALLRAGEPDEQAQKVVIGLENIYEMVHDDTKLHATVDLVWKGIDPTTDNLDNYTARTKCILGQLGNPNAAKAARVLMGGNLHARVGLVSQEVPTQTPLKMLDVTTGTSAVFVRRFNTLLCETALLTVGKGMSEADHYTNNTLREALIKAGKRPARRWTKPTLVSAIKELYKKTANDDGITDWKAAYSTQGWIDLWRLGSESEVAEKNSTKGTKQ